MDTSGDLLLNDEGVWEPHDVLGDFEGSVNEELARQGWDPFVVLGAGEVASLTVRTWQRSRDGRVEYLLIVDTVDIGSPFLVLRDLPTFMDLLARWAPAVQAAAIADVTRDLQETGIEEEGFVEKIAGRAWWGIQENYGQLKRRKWEREEIQRRRSDELHRKRSTET